MGRFQDFPDFLGKSGKIPENMINHMSWYCPNMDRYLFWPRTSTNSRNFYLNFFLFCGRSQETHAFGTFQPENIPTISNFDAFDVLLYSSFLLQKP